MALNLKRKRAADASPRKTRKVSEEPDVVSSNEEMESGGEEFEEEEEEWGGVEGGDDEVKPREPLDTSSKPKKPPTAEEMRAIREATDLYRSSSFKLQIDALLPNVRPKASRIPPLEKFLLNLHTFLLKIPSVSAQHPLEASKGLLKKGIAVPYCLPLPTEETNWKVAFEKPSEITLVGSWANKVSVKPKDDLHYGVDVAVEMPASLFQEKDYLNARFFQKKAFYLATIAQAIQNPKSGLNVDLFYESSSSDPRLTKLVLIPKSDGSQTDFTKLKARVCIIPTLPAQSPIPLHRLSPSHGNLKINTSQQSESPSQPQPTPVYNNALLYSLTPKPHLLATYNLIQSSPAFSDALTLLRIWANQRGFGQGSRMCVKGFEDAGPFWIGLLELLITGEETKNSKRKPLGKGLSSYQLFKAALDCLSKQEFSKAPVFVKTVEGQRYQSDEYQDYWHASLVDSASLVNLLASIPVGCLDLLRYEASKTLEALNSSTLAIDPFTQVFLQDHRDVHTRFDVVLRVDITGAKQRQPSVHASLDRGSTFHQLLFNMDSLLRQALGPRAKAISFLCPSTTPSSPSTRPLSQAHPSTPTTAFIGLILDPEHAFQLVQHGPAAEDQVTPELTAFRELWGPKSELRRFKDGRITESVVWDVKTADERAHIPAMVVKHILDWHFGISQEKVESWQTAYDNLIRLPKEVSGRYVEGLKGTAIGFKGALGAFEGLVKAIKALEEELPLSLVNASAISSSLRYTSVFNPVPLTPGLASSLPPTARYLHPIDIIFEFEKSGKWPDELKAIQKIKLAFFERMAVLLMGSVPGLKASVVLGEGDVTDSNEVVDKAYLEILTPEGWAFRGRIWHDREATLLDRILDERGPLAHIAVPKSKKKEERKGKVYLDAQVAREVYERRFVHAPRHHRAVAALSHRYGAFAGTCRLVKRWFGAHWLLGGHGSEGIGAPLSSSAHISGASGGTGVGGGGHVTEEAIELLCAQFFVGDGKMVGVESDAGVPVPSSVPATKERGFATVLRFLSEWKWEEGGVWVCLYGPRGSEEEESSGAGTTGAVNGASTTGTVPGAGATGATATSGGVWKFNTDMDKEGRMWTKYGPDAIVAKRIRALAVATVRFMQGVEGSGFDVRGMFIHPTEDYDFIVHLDPSVLPRYMHNVNPDPKLLTRQGKYANQVGEKVESVMPGFDPARALFVDLQRTYADTFRLFFDPYGGTQFGGVWDPTLKTARPFRVLGGFNSQPVPKESEKEKDKGLVTLNEGAVLAEVRRMGQGLVKDITRRA